MIFFLKMVCLTTGVAFWGLVLMFVIGFSVWQIKQWQGWQRIKKWYLMATGEGR